jgi:hypothetical protein
MAAHDPAVTNPDEETHDGKIQSLVLDGVPRSAAVHIVNLEARVADLERLLLKH